MADKYVSHSGDDQLGDGSSGSPYRTIQKGIDELGANESCILVNDSDYILEELESGTAGVWNTTNKTLTDAAATFQTNGVTSGDNVFYDGNAYKIVSVDSQTQVTCTAAPAGNPANVSYSVGDQYAYNVVMSNANGDVDYNYWLTLKSESAASRSSIRAGAGFPDNEYLVVVVSDMNKVQDLILVGSGGTCTQVGIWGDYASVFTGFVVSNCDISGFKWGVRADHLEAALVVNCNITLNNADSARGIIFSDNGQVALNNIITGGAGVSSNGIMLYTLACGPQVIGNIVRDFTASSCTGIYSNAQGASIIGNTVYNISGDGSPAGIMLCAASAMGTAVYNNILLSCRRGIGRNSSSCGGFSCLDYNCVAVSVAPYVNISAGTHDISSNPLFVDAANGDFRPCNPAVLRGGKPDIAGNSTQMGAVVQKYQFANLGRAANMRRLAVIR